MLLFLTDENITPVVAEQVEVKRPEISIQSVHHWRQGGLLSKSDRILIRAANADHLTLITFDQRTIPDLLTEFALFGVEQSGVIFVDKRTIASNDIGGLVRAVIDFYDRASDLDWTNRIGFLEAVR